jgi:hypothetical protein
LTAGRTILAAISGGSASAGGIDLACRLAQRFKARVEGFQVVVDPRAEFAATGEGFGLVPSAGLIEAVMDEARAKAAETHALFDTAVARYEIAFGSVPQLAVHQTSACWREETGYGPILVARRARFFDLVVLGRSERVVRELLHRYN